MDNLFEQIANITKAHAYDTIAPHLAEVKEQNKIFRQGLRDVMLIISECDPQSVCKNPGEIISKISNHCNEILSKNRPL